MAAGDSSDAPPSTTSRATITKREMPDGTVRHVFSHDGRKIYEWEQNIEEVIVYITPPEGVKASNIDCRMETKRLKVGLKGNPPFLDEPLYAPISSEDSVWIMDDGELQITLQKLKKAETWKSLFIGHGELDAASASEMQKKLMLERFQQEHPGFDFSNAEFNGNVPDPSKFMGGMRE